jgi:hypothetical protein
MKKKRPEYVRCILAERITAWCGRNVCAEWYFSDINHAALHRKAEGRLLVCPECAEVVSKLLLRK